jgi:hypothetical protein
VVWVLGTLVNVASGVMIVLAFHDNNDKTMNNATRAMTVTPNIVSLGFLIDALYRLYRVSKGALTMHLWQLVWHVFTFLAVSLAGILLCVATKRNSYFDAVTFYVEYEAVLALIFVSELSFVFILYKITAQTDQSKNE